MNEKRSEREDPWLWVQCLQDRFGDSTIDIGSVNISHRARGDSCSRGDSCHRQGEQLLMTGRRAFNSGYIGTLLRGELQKAGRNINSSVMKNIQD